MHMVFPKFNELVRTALIAFAVFVVGVCEAQVQSGPQIGAFLPTGKRWALVIGAENYEQLGELHYVRNDALAFADTLENSFGFTKSTVKVLTDYNGKGQEPTAGHIFGELEELLSDKRLEKGDMFIFYFAGHGVGRKSGDYLLPIDARPETAERLGIPVRELFNRFSKAGLKNVVVIADACRAGTANDFGKELQALSAESHRAVLLACEPSGRSHESSDLKHGVFTHFLLKALRDSATHDSVTGAQWLSTVAREVCSKVATYSNGRVPDGPQKPWIWTDPSLDILLAADPTILTKSVLAHTIKEQQERISASSYVNALTELMDLSADAKDWDLVDTIGKALEAATEIDTKPRVLAASAAALKGDYPRALRYLRSEDPGTNSSLWRQVEYMAYLEMSGYHELVLNYCKKVWNEAPSLEIAGDFYSLLNAYGERQDLIAFLSELNKKFDDPKDPLVKELAAGNMRLAPSLAQVRLFLQGTVSLSQGDAQRAEDCLYRAFREGPHSAIASKILFAHWAAASHCNRMSRSKSLINENSENPVLSDSLPILLFSQTIENGSKREIDSALANIISHRFWVADDVLQIVHTLKAKCFEHVDFFSKLDSQSASWQIQFGREVPGLASNGGALTTARLAELSRSAASSVDYWCSVVEMLDDLKTEENSSKISELKEFAVGNLLGHWHEFKGEYRPLNHLDTANPRWVVPALIAARLAPPNQEFKNNQRIRFEEMLAALWFANGEMGQMKALVSTLKDYDRLSPSVRRLAMLAFAWSGMPEEAKALLNDIEFRANYPDSVALTEATLSVFSRRDLADKTYGRIDPLRLEPWESRAYNLLAFLGAGSQFEKAKIRIQMESNSKLANELLSGTFLDEFACQVICSSSISKVADQNKLHWTMMSFYPFSSALDGCARILHLDVSSFVGALSLAGEVRDGIGRVSRNEIRLTCSTDGSVIGSVTGEDNNSLSISGSVNAYGLLVGEATGGGSKRKVWGRLQPRNEPWWISSVLTKTPGPTFLVFDENAPENALWISAAKDN